MKMNTKSKFSGNKDIELKFKNLTNKKMEKSKDNKLGLSLNKVTSMSGLNKSILNSFRPGVITNVVGKKYNTGKNSPERQFSEEKNIHVGHIINSPINQKSPFNQMNLYNNNKIQINPSNPMMKNATGKKLREIIEDGHEIDSLIKNKIMKKKEKIKSNLMNFSNPVNVLTGTAYYKLHLETSQAFVPNLFKPAEEKKNIINQLHKRSTSTYEDETPHRDELKKSVVSPRLEKLISKYGQYFEKNESSKSKIINNSGSIILKNSSQSILQKDCDSFRESAALSNKNSAFKNNNQSKTIVTTSKTSAGTKNNSRKNSLDKIVFKNAINVNNVKDLKISTNSSSNNSSTTLFSGKYIERGDNINNTESNKHMVGHNKMLSEIPVLSSLNMNMLQNLKKDNFAKSLNEVKGLISGDRKIDANKKKQVPLPNSKKSKIDDATMITGSAVSNSKFVPVTTSHSPSHVFTKDLITSFKDKKNSTPISPKSKFYKKEIFMKNLDLNQIQNEITKQTIPTTFDNRLEKILDNSTDSIRSTMRERDFYKRESEKIINFIRQYYSKYAEYPKTTYKFYNYGRLLGRGAFGKVNLGLHVATGRLVALKSFNKTKLKSENAKKKINYETNILRNLNHPAIVKIYETFETTKHIVIVMEYVSCGELLSFVRKRSKLNENTARYIFKQIIEALQYIHSQNIVHRDIKLDNILIDLESKIKICDFGVSKLVKKNDLMHDQCGTPAYIAPEILKNNGYEGYGVDVWSSGVVLYAMLSGTVPFKANNMKDLHKLILKGSYNKIPDISEDARNIIGCLLETDPKKRITIESILTHPWMRERNKIPLNLFTEAEKIILAKSNVDYRYAIRDDLIENFTLRNIDTAQETENQNIGTKSVILAPFNSSLLSEEGFLNKELTIENEVLKFCGKVKELNRNYELNNNGEIDNGIIISPIEKVSNDNTPIYSPQSHSPFNNSFIFQNKIVVKQVENEEETNKDIHKSLIKNGNNLHSINNKLAISERVVKYVEELGYKKDYLIKSLLNNEINYATAAYYLLLNIEFD